MRNPRGTIKTLLTFMLAAAMLSALGASAQPPGWGERNEGWRVLRDGWYDEVRLEKAGYGLDAVLLLSRHCLGFALPPEALRYFGDAQAVNLNWRVDNRKERYGTFSLSMHRYGVDLCAADTFTNWEKRFAKDVLGIRDDAFTPYAPTMLSVQFLVEGPAGGDVVAEGDFSLDGVRRMACRHRALPKKRLRACGGEAQ